MTWQQIPKKLFPLLCIAVLTIIIPLHYVITANMHYGRVLTTSPRGSIREKSKESTKPNIVYILADDLGYGSVGYNGGIADTPNLNAMATGPNSIQLTRCYSGGPVCSPTRGTLMTGRNHNRFCMWRTFSPKYVPNLPLSEKTVATVLKENGYHTAIFGKWGMSVLEEYNPRDYGFDEFWVTQYRVPGVNPNCGCFEEFECEMGHWSKDNFKCANYLSLDPRSDEMIEYNQPIIGDDSHFIVDLFSQFLRKVTANNSKPFFVYLPFHAVHIPYIATKEYRELYQSRGYNEEQINYLGDITAMDGAVGRVRELLKQYGVSDNTMLWFTSDNGPTEETSGKAMETLKGGKRDCYEGGIRVPGIIEWPAEIKENRVSDYPVVSSDLLPTVCDILGVDLPHDRQIDGISILPFIHKETSFRNTSIVWTFVRPHFGGKYYSALSRGNYKYYGEYTKEGSLKDGKLFDLKTDPYEENNIKWDPEKRTLFLSMKAEYEEWWKSVLDSAKNEAQCLTKYNPFK